MDNDEYLSRMVIILCRGYNKNQLYIFYTVYKTINICYLLSGLWHSVWCANNRVTSVR